MKIAKKLLSTMLALAMVATCFVVPTIPAQAATRTSAFVYDAKTGIYYEDKIRCPIGSYGASSTMYTPNTGDYIASAKSDNGAMIIKVTNKDNYFGNNYTNRMIEGVKDSVKFRTCQRITYYATKAGKYTVTLTVKNAKKKTIATKKVTVYVNNIAYPIKAIKYAGKEVSDGQAVSKQSGALKVSMNKTYKLTKLEIGTFTKSNYTDGSAEPDYKVISNGATITLPSATKYTQGYEYSSYKYNYDYICPVTYVRITYKDNLLNTLYTTTYRIHLAK